MRVRSNERERSRWIALAQVVTNYGGLSSGPLFPRGKGALVALAWVGGVSESVWTSFLAQTAKSKVGRMKTMGMKASMLAIGITSF